MNNRNQPCFCKSGKKFKNCCMNKPTAVEEFMDGEVRTQEYAKALKKDIKYSEKIGKEFGLLKKLIKGE